MAIKRELKWVVAADGAVTPAIPLDGGAQGDHNQTRAIFEVAEGSAWADPANAVYIECDDGAGNVDTTEQLSEVNGAVSNLLPRAWTQYGGTVTLRLVAEGPGIEGMQCYSAEALARLDSRQNAIDKVDSLLKGRMAAAEKAMAESVTSAKYAASSAVVSASEASLSRQGAQLASAAAAEAAGQASEANKAACAYASDAGGSAADAKKYAAQAAQAAKNGAYDVYEIDEYGFAFSDEDGNVSVAISNVGELLCAGKGSGGGGTALNFYQCGLPVLALTGDTTGMSKEKPKPLDYAFITRKGSTLYEGTCECKWQGSSSVRRGYPKRNFTIKFCEYTDHNNPDYVKKPFEATSIISSTDGVTAPKKWGAQHKYCMKANWIDPSAARNVVNAKLWGKVVATRDSVHEKLAASPNYGAVDGFPVVILINGEFEGLYTFNIPKEDWLFNMGDGDAEYIVCGESNDELAAGFYALAGFPEDKDQKDTDFAIEYQPDGVTKETVVNSFNAAINAVMTAPNSAEWESVVAPYFDVQSAIDYYIFVCCIGGEDNLQKNILYATYDGVKWFMSAYDLDTTMGSNPYGTALYEVKSPKTKSFATAATRHRLFELIYKYSKDKLKARYAELRGSVLSDENVWYMYNNFVCPISRAVYNADAQKWADQIDTDDRLPMPATSTANVENFMQYYRMHCALLDKEMEG